MDPRSDTLSELQLIAENVRAGAITASKIAWKLRLHVFKRRKNYGFNKIAWKFRLRVFKRRKNNGFDKIAWKFRLRVIKRRKNKVEHYQICGNLGDMEQ